MMEEGGNFMQKNEADSRFLILLFFFCKRIRRAAFDRMAMEEEERASIVAHAMKHALVEVAFFPQKKIKSRIRTHQANKMSFTGLQ